MSFRRVLGTVGALAALGVMSFSSLAPAATGGEGTLMHALLRSRELWATIDLCTPKDQPDYVGVRGSMPGDKHPHDRMYMSFRLQYLEPTSGKWVDLARGVTPRYAYVGPGGQVRQGGSSFQLVPKAGQPAYTLRGVVDYQWRRAGKVLQSISRTTSAGHKSVSGADPAGYSAASCVIG
jgi:hypothetical protein